MPIKLTLKAFIFHGLLPLFVFLLFHFAKSEIANILNERRYVKMY